ncbi:uncharacterized protein LAESUDRAFT_719444 [Laetiporus sulphureus 93-53]|uniref:Secreted protein n=1 Tax=Laetiporus sulphureus 93-53 TaxID=1314785 RepID=A0A165IIM4_9APHY|nr:uncharacterized protein LAESUDRAFT_719444 [Laetiporus sulphureus 93-53]KZT13127.1 hypothetical protein LAESUDRAFT_719444 [Laetiporus sulphureus 93-53]
MKRLSVLMLASLPLRLPPCDCVSTSSSTIPHTVLRNGNKRFGGATDQRFDGQSLSSCRGLPVSITDISSPSLMTLTTHSVPAKLRWGDMPRAASLLA